ncbi:type II toxin-antitoxin system RelE/ParE family toxin [Oryzicola mucosus]|uniref:Type II toxin-antitoxin system RelE/ParE family toxin n=1 Tax=Oryzicola mucosus TaxID=2767425 RepID=A0A8J6PU99_9HYPH|nr:type II toxin-antitoxin system RelE/ParE family toxin [Oryzicola mucosus]
MAEFRLTPRAEQDIRDIWRTIASESEKAADALVLRLFAKFHIVATQPKMGRAVPEVGQDVRILIEGRYLILYEPAGDDLLIVAVVHGMRNPDEWLS